MVQCSGVSFEISTVIFVIFSLTLTKCDFNKVNAMVGEEIALDFSFPCVNARFILQYEYRPPFYDSANPESLSLPENQELVYQDDFETDICSFQLKINPVLRSNEGRYIFIVDNGNKQTVAIVGLRVDYPSGKASCGWGEENVADDWRSLDCTAQSGSFLGEIVCFQNGIRVPPVGRPRDSDGILKQTIWVSYFQPAFCCVVVVGQPVDRCKCTDYIWDGFSNITEPCPVVMVTTHQETSASSQSPTSIPSQEVTQKTKKNHRPNVVLHVGYSCVIGISAIIIISLCIVLTIRNRKTNRVKKNAKTAVSQPDLVDIEYAPVETDEQ